MKNLKTKIEAHKEGTEFQIITTLREWNNSNIGWTWGTDADYGDDKNEYDVVVNFITDNLHVTLVKSSERISGSVRGDASWTVDEDVEGFFQELIKDENIFSSGKY